MTNHNLAPGSRVRDRIWGGTEAGTVTGVDTDGTVTVQWDSAQFTEDQRTLDEVEPTDGTGDPAPRYMVMYDGNRHEPAIASARGPRASATRSDVTEHADEDTDTA